MSDAQQFIKDPKFDALFARLSAQHRPMKPEFDPERLQALGFLMVRFQRLEGSIRELIYVLGGLADQKVHDILTVQHSFKNLVSVLASLAKHRKFVYRDELDQLLRKCEQAERVRNQLFHSQWTSGPRHKTGVSKKHGLQYKFESHSTEELKCIGATVDHLDTAIGALIWKRVSPSAGHATTPDAPASPNADGHGPAAGVAGDEEE